ncbi:MAG TPA: hypothetical protein VFS11_10280 [Gemmatimonadales bacterium]|nr:hypothetical protein [Gemmatimonadales bacterium]
MSAVAKPEVGTHPEHATGAALAVVRDEPARVVARPQPVDFGQLLELSKALVQTGFLPDHIKTPGQAAAIILTGRELGMEPMRALRSLQMVKGKVVENADSQLARFKTDGGRAVFKELSETRAVLWLRHPNGDEHTETFTLDDAKRAGLTNPSRSGEPSMFVKFPKAMLRSRVITAGLKSVGWEGGAGAYDPEEAQAFTPAVSEAVPGPTGEAGATSDERRARPDRPTQKQEEFYKRLLASHVFTEAEKEAGLDWLDTKATKATMVKAIDRLQAQIKEREAAERNGGVVEVETVVVDMAQKPAPGPLREDPYEMGDAAE